MGCFHDAVKVILMHDDVSHAQLGCGYQHTSRPPH
jgi:hypothetical protein